MLTRRSLPLVLLPLVLVVLAGCRPAAQTMSPDAVVPPPPAAATSEVRVYIPCGMIVPMRAVADAYMKQHPGTKITGVYDNAGVIVKRLRDKGEPADLFVSPGSTEIAALETAGLIKAGTKKPVGDFELVCLVPANSTLGISKPDDLKKVKTMGAPDPRINSVGTSGEQALTKLGLWETLKPRMVFTEHAIQAYTMVAGGKADAAICYRNCPLETNPKKLSKSKVRIAFSFPKDSYTKQQCLIGELSKAGNSAGAEAYITFMTSPEGLKILADNGMTGCLDLAQCPVPGAAGATAAAAPVDTSKATVKVVAYYPGNEEHKPMKAGILALPAKYGGKVSAEFVDFTNDAGFKRWQGDGMTCGGILINGEQTFSYDKGGKPYEVTFKMREGGEWTWADLDAVIKQQLKKSGGS